MAYMMHNTVISLYISWKEERETKVYKQNLTRKRRKGRKSKLKNNMHSRRKKKMLGLNES
jgi:hypothetical protein